MKDNAHVLKVMNWGYFGFENYGDDLLQSVVYQKFTEMGVEIVVPMQTVYPDLKAEQVDRSLKILLSEILNCNVLIMGPGGLFPFNEIKKLAIYLAVVLRWKLKRRKVIFFGVGISEKMNACCRFLWRIIIKCSDLFITRSTGFLESINVAETECVRTLADIAFASDVTKPYAYKNDVNRKTVGIAVANLYTNYNDDLYQKSVDIWSDVCHKILEKGYKIDLIAFTKEKDDRLINDIHNKVDSKEDVQVIPYCNISNAINKWNQYEQVICMRFHSLVLSVLSAVPALPIAYGHKTANLAKESGLSEYLLYWNTAEKKYFGEAIELNAQRIIEMFDAIINDNEDVINNLRYHRGRLITSAETAISILQDNLSH